jgi:hypothetical protein
MNQPTREEFEEFKQEVKEEVRQLREQITEPMKAVRVEVASEDVLKRLDSLDQNQKESFNALVRHIGDETKEIKDAVAGMEERIEAMLIKYLRPSAN